MSADVSEEYIASIIKVEEQAKQETSMRQVVRRICGDGGEISFENLVDFQRTTRHYIPEDRTSLNHRCAN
jgi:hypothetical protein